MMVQRAERLTIFVESMNEFESRRQGFSEGASLVGFAEFNYLADHFQPGVWCLAGAERIDYSLAYISIQIPFTVTADPGDERRGKCGGLVFFPVYLE